MYLCLNELFSTFYNPGRTVTDNNLLVEPGLQGVDCRYFGNLTISLEKPLDAATTYIIAGQERLENVF